ncbi:MAG: ubiquinone/menaquinone biosynthesis C-methylase UbiE [Candidatus Azotimanducaceae bacterium]|jgi:ubiquinone/menaquinone biosynthesis C-methylase UbiE
MVETLAPLFPAEHLDIGSGHGDLIRLLRNRFDVRSSVCDYTDSLMKLPDVSVSVANLNTEGLPFENSAFDLVTCTEVIEHLEHYRYTLREMYRVLKPGGALVLTTPNILNLKSRIRFLIFGFHNLFGPLHFRESNLHSTGGHINPVSFFYLAHSLVDAGFQEIQVSIDKKQGTSKAWLLFLYIPIKLFSKLLLRDEKTKIKTVDEFNEPFVLQINSLDVLLGRTIVVGCKKP